MPARAKRDAPGGDGMMRPAGTGRTGRESPAGPASAPATAFECGKASVPPAPGGPAGPASAPAPSETPGEPRPGRGVKDDMETATAEVVLPRPAALECAPGIDPDLELVKRWQAGDDDAFRQLVQRYQGKIFSMLLRMLPSRQEAEDALQETFLNLHRKGHLFRYEARFYTFVYRVAKNAALNRRRGLKRFDAYLKKYNEENSVGLPRVKVRRPSPDQPDAPPSEPVDPGAGPETRALDEERRLRVQRAIQDLPERLRLPIVLYDLEGHSYAEVARVLEVAEGTVKSRIHRGRMQLRSLLAEWISEEDSR